MKTHANVSLEALEPRLAPAAIVAVDLVNQLHKFDSATPGNVTTVAITGLAFPATEKIMGLDYRPADGHLYALGINVVAGADNDEGRIYIIDPATGVATQVGNAPFFTTFADNNDYAFDVNPVSDRIRVATDRDDNLRVNPNDGSLNNTDADLNPGNPAVVGVAYSNNHYGATTTTLYGIDNATDSLVVINPPNNGTVVNVGALGVGFTSFKVGFDIESRTGTAYAVLTPTAGQTSLYTINLGTGAATLVGAVQGNPSLHGMAVALPDDLTIVDANTATYIDADGDKVTVKMSGAGAGAALGKADFTLAVGQFGSQLRMLDLSNGHSGQEWAKASVTITAVPVGTKGDSFATVGYINATGVDLGKVSVNGDLGQIDAGKSGDAIPGLASLTVQTFGFFSDSQLPNQDNISTITGKVGSLTVKADMANAVFAVSDVDGSLGSVFIGGNLDGRNNAGSGSGTARIYVAKTLGSVVINGSIYGGSADDSGEITGIEGMGNLTIGGSVYGGTGANSAYIAAANSMGNVLVKGSIIGGDDVSTGRIYSTGVMGSVTIKGSLIGGTVMDTVNDTGSGNVAAGTNMGAVVIGGSIMGGNGPYGGNVYAGGTLKSASVGGFLKGDSGYNGGSIESGLSMGNVTVGGDLIGGSDDYTGTIFTFNNGSIANVTIGGSVLGNGNANTGIISDLQLGMVKITGEVVNSRISAEGDTGSPAKLVGIKSLTVGLDVVGSQILAGYDTVAATTNTAATLGPVTIGGDFVMSNMKAGAMGAVTIKGGLDGRGMAAASGVFSLGAIGNLNIGGNLYGGSFIEAGIVKSAGAMGTVTVGGSIFGGAASYAGNIESGSTMGNVLVKGSVFGGSDDHTGNVHSFSQMGNVTVKGSIVGGIVANAAELDSGIIYANGGAAANMGAVSIGGNLVGSNGNFSGSLYASGTIKSVSVAGFVKGGTGSQSGNIEAGAGIGNVTILGDLIGGAGDHSGSVYAWDSNGSIANVTIGGSLVGGHTLTGIMSDNQLGAVKITGGMTGGRISAEGGTNATTAMQASAIKSVSIGGTMQNALILGGYSTGGAATNPDATIGAVTVGGNFIASSIVAGVDDGADNLFGTADDVKVNEAMADGLFSSIASVTIKGYATGTVGGADHFGITAEQVGTIKIGAQTLNLVAGTDTTGFYLGSNLDMKVKEV